MTHRFPYDKVLMLLVVILLAFGVVMVFSTSSVASASTRVFARQAIFLLLGLFLLFVIMQVDYHLYSRWWLVVLLLLATEALLVGALFSPPVNNVHRWLSAGSLRAQPSELAKLAIILFTARFLVSWNNRPRWPRSALAGYLAVLGVTLALITGEPDLGTAACILLVASFLLFVAGLDIRCFAAAAAAALPSFYFLVYRVPYRRDRILAFLDPDGSPLGIGYQIRQSLIAVGSGGWTGLGFAQGRQKLSFLPEPQTDFVYAIVGEELGLLGCLVLLFLFSLLLWRGLRIALRADSQEGTLLALGITAMITFQAFINMGVVLGLLPTKGIPLPLISVGGSSLLVTLAGLGILLNISRFSQTPGRWEPTSPGEG